VISPGGDEVVPADGSITFAVALRMWLLFHGCGERGGTGRIHLAGANSQPNHGGKSRHPANS
jgi:hypothetical protein